MKTGLLGARILLGSLLAGSLSACFQNQGGLISPYSNNINAHGGSGEEVDPPPPIQICPNAAIIAPPENPTIQLAVLNSSNVGFAQKFKTPEAMKLARISVYMGIGGVTPDTVSMTITTDNDGAPSAIQLGQSILQGGQISNAPGYVSFEFLDEKFLPNNTPFWMVIEGIFPSGSQLHLGITPGDLYPDGQWSQFSNGAWTDAIGWDGLFRLYKCIK